MDMKTVGAIPFIVIAKLGLIVIGAISVAVGATSCSKRQRG